MFSSYIPPHAVSYQARQPLSCALSDCLDHTFAPSTIAGYNCSRCGDATATTALALLNPLPLVFCLCIQRGAWERGSSRKIQTAVTPPIELDFGPYLRPTVFGGLVEVPAYSLYAVIAHEGSRLTSGHYTAFCRTSPYRSICGTYAILLLRLSETTHWTHLNDSRVSLVDTSRALNAQAYLLFYSRR